MQTLKRNLTVLAFLAFLFVLPASAMPDGDIPGKDADEVADVNEPYSASGWIVSPDDRLASYVSVENAPECDIRGVISCYDRASLRVDILLQNPVTYQVKVWYAIKFVYTDTVEYYTYYPASGDFIYEKEENGTVVNTENLKGNKTDFTGVTDSGDKKNTDIYLIINKDKHIAGDPGKTYYLTTSFYSGYIDTSGAMKIADQTRPVNLYFKR